MDIKIVLGIEIRNKKPVIYYKNNVIIFDENNYSEIILEDKQEIGSVFNFAVENIENNSASILIKKILINGIEANIFHNTSFIMKNNRWVENKTLKSVYRIDYNGTFALDITEQYVAPIKSQHWHVSNTINDYETVNNLAVPGAKIDLIYNNFVRLCKEHSFKKIIIVLPHLERRVIKCRVDDGKFYRVPNAFSPANDSNAWRYANYPVVMKKRKHVEEQMVKDIDCVYSKKIIKKMISVAKKQSIHLFLSSRSEDTYNFLQSLTLTNSRLLPFYNINWFKERAPNGYHPSPTHNDHFVNLILDQI